jgi:hypothetical protein
MDRESRTIRCSRTRDAFQPTLNQLIGKPLPLTSQRVAHRRRNDDMGLIAKAVKLSPVRRASIAAV